LGDVKGPIARHRIAISHRAAIRSERRIERSQSPN
jgi:hypothetical protein